MSLYKIEQLHRSPLNQAHNTSWTSGPVIFVRVIFDSDASRRTGSQEISDLIWLLNSARDGFTELAFCDHSQWTLHQDPATVFDKQ